MLRRFLLLPALAVALAAPVAVPSFARADAGPLDLSCAPGTSDDGVHYRLCSGEVPSFDGTGLDVDLTLPEKGSAPYPTVLLLHGWGSDKHEWEASSKDGDGGDKYHWNNVWFASQGYATLTYTARGFEESCGLTDTDANCARTGVHLADRRWETKDSQTLLGDLVDTGVANPTRLAASGGSYGGGQSWLLATSMPWQSAKGATLQLAAAIPHYPWTDLLYSLAPNGRENDDPYVPADDAAHSSPFGIEKASYVTGLYAIGRTNAQGRYDPADGVPDDPASDLDAQIARTDAGEPYDTPDVQTFAQDYRNKSAYYADDYFAAVKSGAVRPVPVLSIQGFTDPLFPAVETLQMYRKLKAFDPDYPVAMAFADIGHDNAQNPHPQWRWLNNQGNEFLNFAFGHGVGTPTTTVSVLRTQCPASDTLGQVFAGTSWDAIRRGVVHATAASTRTTTSAAVDPAGAADDPITHGAGCFTTSASASDDATSWSWQVPVSGFTQLGLPRLTLDYTMTGSDATLALRLWDVAPDGTKTLVDRGEYRLTAAANGAAGTLTTELYGNCWDWQAGHVMQLQVTQNDFPYLRPDNEASQLSLSNPRFDVPTAEARSVAVTTS